MDSFNISAISGANFSTTNISAISDVYASELGAGDLSIGNLSTTQHAELSMRLSTTERNYRELKIDAERQMALFRAETADKDERCSRLEMQLTETSARAESMLQSYNDDVHKLAEQKKAAEADKMRLTQLNSDLSTDLDRKRNELAEVKMKLSLAEERATRATSLVESQMTEFRDLRAKYNMTKRRLLEAMKMKTKIEALESENDRLMHEGSAKMRLSSDLQSMSELERQNLKLKQELSIIRQYNESIDVLKEKVTHLTATLDATKADLGRLGSVEAENNFLKEKLRFLGVAADVTGATSVESLDSLQAMAERVKNLEAAAKVDANEIASLRETVLVHKNLKSSLESQVESLKESIAKLEKENEEHEESLVRSQSQLAMSTSERDSFKSLCKFTAFVSVCVF